MKIVTAAWVVLLASAAAADTIKLKNGGQLEGVILKEYEGSVVVRLKYATVTLDKSDIDSIEKKKVDEGPAPKAMRLSRWDRCLEVVAARPWATEFRQIPSTVVDVGVLKHVPYMSHKSGNYEFNLYGDPDAPACLEIGVYKDLLRSEAAKKECLEVMSQILGDPKDAETLRSLGLAPAKKERDGLTFEVTPETAEDAYGGWWISVYDVKALDSVRATEEELKRITVDEDDVKKDEEEARKVDPKKHDPKKPQVKSGPPPETVYTIWRPPDLNHARVVPQHRRHGLRRVYIRGITRHGGVWRPSLSGIRR